VSASDPAPWAEPECALRSRLAAFVEAFDAAPEPVIVLDREGRIRFANRSCTTLFGGPPARLLGRTLADFVQRREKMPTASYPAPGGGVRGGFELVRPGAEPCFVAWSASPLLDADGSGIGVTVFLRDDTERRRIEVVGFRRLDELEQTLRGVAHDLRSPLVAVLGFSRLLRDDFAGLLGERGTHYLDRISEAGRSMEALIRELLDFTRIGNAGERAVFVDPREVLEQLHREFKPRLDGANVVLRSPAEPPLVLCDRTRLYQIFSNLIGNALDHMGSCAAPVVVIEVREEPEQHLLVVRDNGRGVEPAERERIFEMFHSAPGATGRKGTGIGLAIVKKIAELHGGRAWVDGAPGGGAAFYVSLPRS
jgi:PAS domain S-box-containing protein